MMVRLVMLPSNQLDMPTVSPSPAPGYEIQNRPSTTPPTSHDGAWSRLCSQYTVFFMFFFIPIQHRYFVCVLCWLLPRCCYMLAGCSDTYTASPRMITLGRSMGSSYMCQVTVQLLT